ncbi:MAG TPA: protease modulator HflK [Allosphingosinicella sp.]|nr:protease modulator HflK [Allosphingosinicella sp.]
MKRFFGWFRRPGMMMSDNRGGPWGPGGGGGGDGGGGNDGGGGGGPRNPWGPGRRKPGPRGGGGGGRGGGDVTSLDEFLRRSRARFGGGIPGGSRPWIVYGLIIAVLLWIAFTSIHRIGPQEKGVVTTLGWYSGTLQPGIGFSWPYPIGSVTKVDTAGIRDLQIPGGRAENLILTGDQNVINLGYTVRWNIRSPELYLFQLADPDETVREVAESAMREAVARVSLDDALGAGRGDIEQRVQRRMQEVLDRYDSGIQIQSVSVSQSAPPAQVNAAFLEVSAATQRAQSAVNAARGYAQQITARAQGEAAQFERLYTQYRLAPEVTRRRMYYETMEAILQQTDTTVVEAPGVQPFLPLPSLQGRGGAATPAPATGAGR